MGDGVERTCHRHRDRQAGHQFRVVEDDLGLDPRIGQRGLLAALGLAQDRRRLGPGIGRGHDDLGQVGAIGDGLGQSRGRPAAHGDDTIRADLGQMGHCLARHLDRRVHGRAGKDPGGQIAHVLGKRQRRRRLLWGRQDQCARRPEGRDLFGHAVADARSEPDRHRVRAGDEAALKIGHESPRDRSDSDVFDPVISCQQCEVDPKTGSLHNIML